MSKRVLLAGLLGGIAMFAWTSLAHMVLPLGDAGIKELPNDQGVLSAMHASIGEASGLYIFPNTGLGPDATMQQKRAAMDQYGQKLAANPSGILIYHPAGAKPISAGQLGTEFLTELIESLLNKLREPYIDPEAVAIRQRAAGGCPPLFNTHFSAAFRPRLNSEAIDFQS